MNDFLLAIPVLLNVQCDPRVADSSAVPVLAQHEDFGVVALVFY
jgi:hypothetical protein